MNSDDGYLLIEVLVSFLILAIMIHLLYQVLQV